jgi:hypothetical protein
MHILHILQEARATEELQLLAWERARCLSYFAYISRVSTEAMQQKLAAANALEPLEFGEGVDVQAVISRGEQQLQLVAESELLRACALQHDRWHSRASTLFARI